MTPEYLSQMVEKHKTDPNYQYRELSWKQFDKMANESVKRLSQEQQEKLAKVCTQYDLADVMLVKRARFMAQTNLFFLCKLLEKYKDVSAKEYVWTDGTVHNTHEEICNLFFVRKDPTFETFKLFAGAYIDKKERLLLVPRGGFKALDLDTEIPTPFGFRYMKNLQVGDWVFGDDGFPSRIIGTSETFIGRKCYEVTFSTGEIIVADAEHSWITDSRKDRENKKVKSFRSVKSTQEIADTLLCRKEHNHRVHIAAPVEYPNQEFIISPYVLGCWLGDGTTSNSNITIADEQIVNEIRNEGEAIRKSGSGEYLYVMNGGEGHKWYKKKSGMSFASRLRSLKLIGNKNIPEIYLRGSYNQRLSLLQGLMDTDGTCDDRGHSYFSNTNFFLIQQVRELIASLGLKPFKICSFDSMLDGRVIGTVYQLGFKAYRNIPVFRLFRKFNRQQDEKRTTLSRHRHIIAVREISSRPTKCISVDSMNHTYLVGRSYIPTHNSSIDMADCVQWIICFPEVTILVLTGVLDLARDFVGEIKGHFTLEEGGTTDVFNKKNLRPRKMNDGTLSLFQVLFPEHCIPADEGKAYEYQTPAVSVVEKETTVFAASIEQNLAGWHVGVLKLDDVVTNENSQTPDRLRNVNKQVSINQAMLHPYGFYDKIGTWYDAEDTYGQDIKNFEKYSLEGEEFPMNIYIRAAWWATEDAKKLGKIEEEMEEKDYVLWFNEGEHALTYKFLREKKKTDPWFGIKYLNDPTQMHTIKFPRELLVRRTVNAIELPGTGMIVTCVDTAYSTKSWADYTVILTALIYGGRFYIIDMKRGRYNEYELPALIAATALQWKPKRVCIEETGAIRYIQREVYREMDKLKIRVPIELVPLGQGSKASSKKVKAGPVLRFLGDDRLRFINTCPGLEDLYEELSKFGTAASTHDDIVDVLAILVNQFSGYADIEGRMTAAADDYVFDPKAKQFYDQTYGDGRFSKYNAKNSALEFPDMSQNELAKDAALDATEAVNDPLGDLF